MGESILFVGPHRQVQDLFNPLWVELDVERQRFTSIDAALEVIQSDKPPSAVLVSYPLWGSSLDDLLVAMGRSWPSEHPVPVVILAAEKSMVEVEPFEDRGVTVLSEDRDPEELRGSLRNLLGRVRRAHPRMIVRMAVQVGAGAVLRACQTEDLSLSGMLIRTSEEFPVGSQVKLEFAVRDDEGPIRCGAEVMRYTQPDLEKSRGMGVHFVAFEEDGEDRLREFLGE